ncbi:ubiquitin-like domain-containing protein [Chloropicon primus]|uniref:Ubiquitin-like domain-containing protein n=1 Tax=Chloropicon primus TaxID=1764295 RepID=A0A5B8MNR8_9CHLO|nr:hypothetical protein A3770_04p35080 [Chloropicon primus]UPR00201.1 ubiquitin-like domain-containing protein [Chloropicon primus]|eukprot:QDZ20990.1 hypothetical protein A3770_04p35080 [Chloropicon primus]
MRVRVRGRKGRGRVEVEEAETIGEVKNKVREVLPEVGNRFELSLNKRDILHEELSVTQAGLARGDLLHILGEESDGGEWPGTRASPMDDDDDGSVWGILARELRGFGFERVGPVAHNEAWSDSDSFEARRERFRMTVPGAAGRSEEVLVASRTIGDFRVLHSRAGSSDCVYSAPFKRPVEKSRLLDRVVLPLVRDARSSLGLEPPALLDTVSNDLLFVILVSLGRCTGAELASLACTSKKFCAFVQQPETQQILRGAKARAQSARERANRQRRLMDSPPRWQPHDDFGFPGRQAFLGRRV